MAGVEHKLPVSGLADSMLNCLFLSVPQTPARARLGAGAGRQANPRNHCGSGNEGLPALTPEIFCVSWGLGLLPVRHQQAQARHWP